MEDGYVLFGRSGFNSTAEELPSLFFSQKKRNSLFLFIHREIGIYQNSSARILAASSARILATVTPVS